MYPFDAESQVKTSEADAECAARAPIGELNGGEPARATDLVLLAIRRSGKESLTFQEVADGLGDRAFGLLLLLFALPNCVPSIPAIGSLLGVPIVAFAWQMLRGSGPRLPGIIGRRSMARSDLLRIVEAGAARVRTVERIIRPRMTALASPGAERVIGAFVMLLGITITIPIPLTNMLPAIGCALIGLAIAERDGVLVLIGAAAGLAGIAVAVLAVATVVALPFVVLG